MRDRQHVTITTITTITTTATTATTTTTTSKLNRSGTLNVPTEFPERLKGAALAHDRARYEVSYSIEIFDRCISLKQHS